MVGGKCSDPTNIVSHSCRRMVLWVFGYGSLIWNPGFEYDEKVIGFVKDYKRTFNVGKYLLNSFTNQCNVSSLIFTNVLVSYYNYSGWMYQPASTIEVRPNTLQELVPLNKLKESSA